MEERIKRLLLETEVIKTEEIELYSYGLGLLVKKIVHITIILTIGVITGKFGEVLFFLLAYSCIREYSGGYHAKTEAGCCICSIIVTVSVVTMIYLLPRLNSIALQLFLLICAMLIWVLSPQDSYNKPLDVEEVVIFRKKARKLLTISAMILLLTYSNDILFLGIACSWIVQTVMLSTVAARKFFQNIKRKKRI